MALSIICFCCIVLALVGALLFFLLMTAKHSRDFMKALKALRSTGQGHMAYLILETDRSTLRSNRRMFLAGDT